MAPNPTYAHLIAGSPEAVRDELYEFGIAHDLREPRDLRIVPPQDYRSLSEDARTAVEAWRENAPDAAAVSYQQVGRGYAFQVGGTTVQINGKIGVPPETISEVYTRLLEGDSETDIANKLGLPQRRVHRLIERKSSMEARIERIARAQAVRAARPRPAAGSADGLQVDTSAYGIEELLADDPAGPLDARRR